MSVTFTATAGSETFEIHSEFARRYALTSTMLAYAMESGRRHDFERAATQALLTIGNVYTIEQLQVDDGARWKIAQNLAKTVHDIASQYGHEGV